MDYYNKNMKTKLIIAFVLGIIAAAFAYHAHIVYTLRAQVEAQGATLSQQGTTISQIVTFLNDSIKNNSTAKSQK